MALTRSQRAQLSEELTFPDMASALMVSVSRGWLPGLEGGKRWVEERDPSGVRREVVRGQRWTATIGVGFDGYEASAVTPEEAVLRCFLKACDAHPGPREEDHDQ